MKVILTKDVQSLGRAGDIKEVNTGYARNFLLRLGMAKIATPTMILQAQTQQAQKEDEQKEKIKDYKETAARLKGTIVEFQLSGNKKEGVFKNISPADIAEQLKVKGFEIEKDKIEFKPTKATGDYETPIKLGLGVSSSIIVKITR